MSLEGNYSVGECEALASAWAVEKRHTCQWGRYFTLRIDHQTLLTLHSSKGTGHRPMIIVKWKARLSHYYYIIKYKPGSQDKIADTLSRFPTITSVNEDDGDVVCKVVLTDTCSAVTRTELKNATNEDAVCTQLMIHLNTGRPEAKKQLLEEAQSYNNLF